MVPRGMPVGVRKACIRMSPISCALTPRRPPHHLPPSERARIQMPGGALPGRRGPLTRAGPQAGGEISAGPSIDTCCWRAVHTVGLSTKHPTEAKSTSRQAETGGRKVALSRPRGAPPGEHGIAAEVVRRQEAAHHPDRRLEHRGVVVPARRRTLRSGRPRCTAAQPWRVRLRHLPLAGACMLCRT